MTIEQAAEIQVRWATGVRVEDLQDPEWERADPVAITRYWSGETAPSHRHGEARILWSNEALFVRFICHQGEPLIINPNPQTQKKTIGLWDRDVCEIYIAPDPIEPERYFELEAAPTGEWLDLAIHHQSEQRETDWEFASGMTAAARVEEDRVAIAMRVPWSNSINQPQRGERWRANVFRCVGAGETRGYLAWQPTRTAEPNFHVPDAFGWLRFV